MIMATGSVTLHRVRVPDTHAHAKMTAIVNAIARSIVLPHVLEMVVTLPSTTR
ncbi:hypothetical protein GCM10011610_29100 [Nocardia rhizosphaerihabitans]|uniref:Uncharacterized protein n=1 Tax=Nocardia rhizosphaerihabitans TaxID=1691570 RepID=A0ABQ2KF90_9NOCA|nr:hypothetical protein GCM10011610_29100 [Nocardia rhizosphaerihabitans]